MGWSIGETTDEIPSELQGRCSSRLFYPGHLKLLPASSPLAAYWEATQRRQEPSRRKRARVGADVGAQRGRAAI
jgi:hypothetical protein